MYRSCLKFLGTDGLVPAGKLPITIHNSGDDQGARLVSGPVPMLDIPLLALCCFRNAFLKYDHKGFLANAARQLSQAVCFKRR